MHVFGTNDPGATLAEEQVAPLLARAREKQEKLRRTPIREIVDVLHRIGREWLRGSRYFERAMAALPEEIPFSPPMIASTLEIVEALLERDALLERIGSELGPPDGLDRFVRRDGCGATTRAFPLGILVHVSAGNVFLGCVDSLLMGFLTKNVSILKLSSKNQVFPSLFAESIAKIDTGNVVADTFALVHWPGGRHAIESAFKTGCDGILVWGGEEAVASYRAGLAPQVRLIEHGPKVSCQVVTRRALEEADLADVGRRIARDVSIWDQAACASPQNLFFEEGVDVGRLMEAIGAGLDSFPLPRGRLTRDEHAEILKERFRGRLTSLCEGGHELAGQGYYLHHDPHPGLRPSPLNRTLVLKSYRDLDDLVSQLAPFAFYLQSVGYLAGGDLRERLLDRLGAIGITRFAPVGSMMDGMIGAPHDGQFGLSQLVRFVSDEAPFHPVAFVNDAIDTVPYYRDLRAGRHIRTLDEMGFLTARELTELSPGKSEALLREGEVRSGFLFASGGTTGQPKFTHYAYREFQDLTRALARSYTARGLARGEVVANLFVAGNMWSSFVVIERCLEHLGALQLPIGGTADADLVLSYLRQFRPKAVFGLPSLVVDVANRAIDRGVKLEIPWVFYAGEHLNRGARGLLADVFGTRGFYSAGYASVDAGFIGYQCAVCEGSEHHLFTADVHLEIVDGEAVVTSRIRRSMPIVRYRTGDRVDWIEGPCACGSPDRRFSLLGRCDSQINIWSCRVHLAQIEAALAALGVRAPIFQVELGPGTVEGRPVETLTLTIERRGADPVDVEAVRRAIFDHCLDLKTTLPFEEVRPRIDVRVVGENAIARVERTGKVRPVVDRR